MKDNEEDFDLIFSEFEPDNSKPVAPKPADTPLPSRRSLREQNERRAAEEQAKPEASDTEPSSNFDQKLSAAEPKLTELDQAEESARQNNSFEESLWETESRPETLATPKASHKERASGKAKNLAKKKKSKSGVITLSILLVLLLAGGVGAFIFRDQLSKCFASLENCYETIASNFKEPEITDFEGTGENEIIFEIAEGEYGDAITTNLVDKGIVKTFDAFYALLLEAEPEPNFYPGHYRLKEKMSAQSALDALLDPENRVENSVLIHEGIYLDETLKRLSESLNIPLEDLKAEVSSKNKAKYGVAKESPNFEGYLFPATYVFPPNVDAETVIRTMVDKTYSILDKYSVAKKDRHKVITLASIIQREAGAEDENFYKVSRVFHNRLDDGWKLESDATTFYGTGRKGSLELTYEEINDKSNPYNTRVHSGYPPGAISTVSELAIDAAVNPAKGSWYFFVTVNPDTGETVFSKTEAEHIRASDRYREWCAKPENEQYC